jgi:hypothetical protein
VKPDLIGQGCLCSCDVLEDAFVVGVTLDEAAHDELLDSDFNGGGLGHELGDEQFDGLLLERVVIDRATGFHYLDDSSFDLISAEVFDLFLHAGVVLFLTLLTHHHWNLVPEERALVVGIDTELVFSRE